jgi:monoamine oxidase
VFALPFTKLREVDLSGVTLSDEKRNMIDTLGYGTNAKVMIGFSSRVWNVSHDTSGGMVTDLGVQQSWDTTIGQDGAHGILTNFLGGQAGLDSGAGEATDWAEGVMPDLETIWPGMQAAYTGEAVRMHWPTVPTMKGSYACYKPGQWAFFGLEGEREGNLHFCGEHTSLDFQGYMEGGAESGGFVAAEIIEDSDMAQPQGMIKALGVKLLVPQAGYRAQVYGNMNAFQRRRRARAIYAELAEKVRASGVGPSAPR